MANEEGGVMADGAPPGPHFPVSWRPAPRKRRGPKNDGASLLDGG